MKSLVIAGLLLIALEWFAAPAATPAAPDSAAAVDIGSRRELLVDDFLIERRDGAELRLHTPTPREIVLPPRRPLGGQRMHFLHRVSGRESGADMVHRGRPHP